MPERVLVALAHPDDESFGCAGTIRLHVEAGTPVTYVCATRGQMGRHMGTPPFANRETLASLRDGELAEACRVLGIEDLRQLGLWDKTVEFVDQTWLVGRMRAILEELRPQRVYTFHPEFGGHPDHNAIGRATIQAIQQLPKVQRPSVRCPAHRLAPDAGLPLEIVDISAVWETKLRAIRAHRSQVQLAKWIDDPEQARERWSKERFWEYPVI